MAGRVRAASGLSVANFCQQESISAASFYAWRRKLKERDVESGQPPGAKAISAARLLPVQIQSSVSPVPVRILLPRGVSIEAPDSIDDGVLANLLRVLGEAHRC